MTALYRTTPKATVDEEDPVELDRFGDSPAKRQDFPTAVGRDRSELTPALVNKHSDRLFKYCRRLSEHHELAHDLTQETWLRAHRRGLPTAMPPNAIFRWLAAVARRAFLNRLKRERRYVPLLPSHDRGLPNCDPARRFEEAEQVARVKALAKELDNSAFVILSLRMGNARLKWSQVAEAAGLSVRTARRRYKKLMVRLQARLREGHD
jgi:RNA polymerase sigma factor (sigma-70 family)